MTTAATTVLLVYFLLCAENYRWHWRAFAGAGMTGFYVFINAIIFWITRVSFGGLTGAVLYVGYSALIGFLVFILTGKIFVHEPAWIIARWSLIILHRFHWILRQLGVCATHLWLDQGRLNFGNH